jgi:hypothetical protein
MELSSSWEAASCSTTQELSSFYGTWKFTLFQYSAKRKFMYAYVIDTKDIIPVTRYNFSIEIRRKISVIHYYKFTLYVNELS